MIGKGSDHKKDLIFFFLRFWEIILTFKC